jgi:transposase-like protein
MYSYEDRLRAVQLYIKLGKRVGVTIRQLGYPTKNALKGWYQAYARDAAMPAGYARQPRYTQARRDLAVEHYRTHGRCLAVTIRELGYPSRTLLAAWVQGRDSAARVRVVGRSPEASPAMKQSAVIALCMRQTSAQSVAKDVGVSRPTLYECKHQLLGHDTTAPMPRSQDSPTNPKRACAGAAG